MTYTDVIGVSEYMSLDEDDLPNDIDRMIDRASDLIDYYSLNKIDSNNNRQLEVAKKATNAQIEYWLNTNDELNIMHIFQGVTAGGDISINREGKLPELAPRAKRALLLGGLYNRSV